MKILKESDPVQVAEYVMAHAIDDEPNFSWWIPYTMRTQDVIVTAVNSCVKRKTHKYGIEILSSIKEALRLDKEGGDTLWTDSTNLEMSNVGIAFDILHDSQCAPVGWRNYLTISSLMLRWTLLARKDR